MKVSADEKDGKGQPRAAEEAFNVEQKAAIEHNNGAVCILAGPGTGKTKTLTARIAYLLKKKRVPPTEIVALTFTNKAAHEMRERVSALLGGSMQAPLICTFHALARTLLNDKTPLIDEPTRTKIIHEIMHARHLKGRSVRDLALDISRAKNRVEPVADSVLAGLVHTYDEELAVRGLHDFDDLLRNLHAALTENVLAPEPHFQHILVDEFQDTNALQYAILQLLDTTGNVFVIGDPLQSIYGFRGAHAGVFDQFEHDWPNAARITLHVNYRSVPEIVTAANALFRNAPQLSANRQDHGLASLVETLNEYGEAAWIVGEIERQIGGSDMLRSSKHHAITTGRTFRDFAVLYRTHATAKTLQMSLEASGIPYQIAGEGSPYFDPGVQAILQSLGYLEGRVDMPAAKGFTASQLKTLLGPIKARSIVPESLNLVQLTRQIIETLGLSYEDNPRLRQFSNSLLAFEQLPMSEYLNHIDSMAEQAYYDPTAEAITLLTIHAAKGLEFPCVFLLGTEQGMLPHSTSGITLDEQALAEEKRLFYVAITRARNELYLMHARSRRRIPQTASSFVTDLPAGTVGYTVDAELGHQQQRLHKRALKRAQSTLF